MIKLLTKLGIEVNFPNSINNVYKNSMVNFLVMVETSSILPKSRMRQEYPLSTLPSTSY